MNNNTKRVLIDTSKRLLTSENQPDKITARQISLEAGTNLAMINYNFKSKDELLKIAVGEIIAEEFKQYQDNPVTMQNPKEQLKNLLYHTCEVTVKYSNLTKLSIPYLLLNDDITLPYDILPFINAYYKGVKSETECKLIAFQMIYTLQIIFYRSEDFYKYSGIDINKMEDRMKLMDYQFDMFLAGGVDDEK